MKTFKIKCRNCGAAVEADPAAPAAHCPYCRCKLLIDAAQLQQILAEQKKADNSSDTPEEVIANIRKRKQLRRVSKAELLLTLKILLALLAVLACLLLLSHLL